MKQATRHATTNEYTQNEQRSGPGSELAFVAMKVLGTLELLCGALVRPFRLFVNSTHRNDHGISSPRLVLSLDKAVGSLSLVLANQSRTLIWAEEVTVDLVTDAETDSERYKTTRTVLKICKQVPPSQTLPISLMNTIYNVAGRPRGFYSCAIFAVLRYRMDGDDRQEFEQPLPPYHARMTALVPISLKRIGWLNQRVGPQPENMSPHEPNDAAKCARRSERITAKSAVVVEGRFNDGSEFSDSTHTLVLSAHGCLVTLAKPVRIGHSVIVRNASTLQEQRCQVAYVRRTEGGEIRVGLAFEMEAPDFWGIDGLPMMAVGESPATS